jgi:hypothetical protein
MAMLGFAPNLRQLSDVEENYRCVASSTLRGAANPP